MTTGGNSGDGNDRREPAGHVNKEIPLKLPTLPPVIFGIPILPSDRAFSSTAAHLRRSSNVSSTKAIRTRKQNRYNR